MDEKANDDQYENGITMVDVLKQEEELEDDAEAVLGASDDSVCTYDQGYMKRQPLYACLTCCPSSSEENRAALCLACSYNCHEDHELIELYTKRYFKCDCGNSKFPTANVCKMNSFKSPVNEENVYNQNFEGKYCSCSRPYPDPEDEVEDNMIQCIICEDWYHGRHLQVESLPTDESYSEMICFSCVPKLPFLVNYAEQTVDTRNVEESVQVDVENMTTTEKDSNSTASVEPKNSEQVLCKMKKYPSRRSLSPGAAFFVENWRSELCSCEDCKKMYSSLKVSFLTDPQDTVAFHESQGRVRRERSRDSAEREIQALSSLDRVTRTEVVQEYNNLSSSLREYLRKFAENGKVVKDEDIREFFSQLNANKRQRTNSVQYFCK